MAFKEIDPTTLFTTTWSRCDGAAHASICQPDS